MLLVGRRRRLAGQRHRIGVAVVVLLPGDIGRVGKHQPNRNAKGLLEEAGPLLHSQPIEASYSDGGNVLVMDLVGTLTGTGAFETEMMGAGCDTKDTAIGSRASGVVRAVVADETCGVTVELIRPDGVHAAN